MKIPTNIIIAVIKNTPKKLNNVGRQGRIEKEE